MHLFRKVTSRKSSSTPNTTAKDSIAQNTRDVNTLSRSMPTRRPAPVAEEPPPAYTPRTGGTTVTPTSPTSPTEQLTVVPVQVEQAAVTAEDSPYAFLQQFDTIFLIDDSGSMAGRGWRETSQALGVITPICTQHDEDGVDIYFLNHRKRSDSGLGGYYNVTTTSAVNDIFTSVRPSGGTPTGTRLNHILKPYLLELEEDLKKQARGAEASVKPLNIIVITDGVPSDDVESVIVRAAKKLDELNAEPWQVGIQFFQVGQEPDAAEELKDLDDALAKEHNIRDMVDTVPWDGEDGAQLTAQFVLKVVMGSINRRLDRRSV